MTPILYFFGPHPAQGNRGHVLREEGSRYHLFAAEVDLRGLPWPDYIAYKLAAGGSTPHGQLPSSQPEGRAYLTQRDGWTAIGFWDRSGDPRGNCVGAFYTHATLTFEEFVSRARESFPELFERFTFDLVLAGAVELPS